MRRPLLLSLLLTVPVAVAAAAPAEAARTPKLPAFEDCSELVDYARAGVLRPSVPVRVPALGDSQIRPRAAYPEPKPRPPVTVVPDGSTPMPMPTVAPSASPERPTSAGSAGDADATVNEDFSGTNVQELGIDEPDVVKSDGKRLFVVVGTELWAYDITQRVPKLLSKLGLEGAGGELLLRGDRILLLGRQPQAAPAAATRAQSADPAVPPTPAPAPTVAPPPPVVGSSVPAPGPAPVARLAEIDARNAAAMKIVRTMEVPGNVISARLTRGTIRVILSSPAALPDALTPPATPTAPEVDAAYRSATKQLGKRAFVPRTTLESRRTDRTFRRDLVPCDDVRHPARYAGLDLLTVLTVDFDEGLFNVDRDAVMAGAQVVYASEGSLYVASTRALDLDAPSDVPRSITSEIHRFDTTKDGETEYLGTGTVPGYVLNQYALSEHEGDLRVATTQVPLWVPGAVQATPSESHVTVLRPEGRSLRQVGQVSGLGKTERIYAARFIGDQGYVVTFRQTDPLYTIDLSDPTAPKVTGELKISGYSAYLHPIGDGLLLGVGRDNDPKGWGLGAQVSVFDVSNPAAPTRLHQQMIGNGTLGAEFDPHAFLWWPARTLALIPYNGWDTKTYRSASAAIGFTATRQGLSESGRITHGPDWDHGRIVRSMIVGDRVITVSELGVSANGLSDFAQLGWLPFVG